MAAAGRAEAGAAPVEYDGAVGGVAERRPPWPRPRPGTLATSAPSESPWITEVPSARAPRRIRPVRDRLLPPASARCPGMGHAPVHDEMRALTQVLGPARGTPCARSTAATRVSASAPVDHEDEDAPRALGGAGDLDVVDADAGIGGQRRDLGQHARPVGDRDAQLGQVLGPRRPGRQGVRAAPAFRSTP